MKNKTLNTFFSFFILNFFIGVPAAWGAAQAEILLDLGKPLAGIVKYALPKPLAHLASIALKKHDDLSAIRQHHHSRSFTYGSGDPEGGTTPDVDRKTPVLSLDSHHTHSNPHHDHSNPHSFPLDPYQIFMEDLRAAKRETVSEQEGACVEDPAKKNYVFEYFARVLGSVSRRKSQFGSKSKLHAAIWQEDMDVKAGYWDGIRQAAHKVWGEDIINNIPSGLIRMDRKSGSGKTESGKWQALFQNHPVATVACIFTKAQSILGVEDRQKAKNSAARVFKTGGTYGLDFAKPVDRDERKLWIKGLKRFGMEQAQDSTVATIYTDLRVLAFSAPRESSRNLLEHQAAVYMGWVMGYWHTMGRKGRLLERMDELDSEFQRAYGVLGEVPGILEGVRPIINGPSHLRRVKDYLYDFDPAIWK